MPLVKRTVQPKHISRIVIDKSIDNELECVSNSTLANLIRQLSSLSAHAEDLFTELYHETCCSFSRMAQLNDRVDRLKIKITQLNHTVEEGKCSLFVQCYAQLIKSTVYYTQHVRRERSQFWGDAVPINW